MTLFFALLAGALAVAIVAVVTSLVVDRQDRLGIVAGARSVAYEGAAAVAAVATLGSLYLSEVAGFDPCRLCWVQRGFMYPAAVILIVAAVVRRRSVALVGGALALVGLGVSVFHRIEQSVGEIGTACDIANPCSGRWLNHFGFVTIPTMAAVAFAGILMLVALTRSET